MSIEKKIYQATMTDHSAEREQIIHELAREHSTTLSDIIAILQSPKETLCPTAIRIIQTIGYPDNLAALLPLLIMPAIGIQLYSKRHSTVYSKLGYPLYLSCLMSFSKAMLLRIGSIPSEQ